MIDAGRQKESILAIQALLVGCVSPRLAMARAQMLLAVDAGDQTALSQTRQFALLGASSAGRWTMTNQKGACGAADARQRWHVVALRQK